jgi:TonB family protein
MSPKRRPRGARPCARAIARSAPPPLALAVAALHALAAVHAVAVVQVVAPATAAAQDASPPAGPALVPPRPAGPVVPPYPESRRGSGEAPSVETQLVIGVDGAVREASLVPGGGAGEPWDSVALETMRAARFEPARRDGTPIAARVRFRVDFAVPDDDPSRAPRPGDTTTGDTTTGDGATGGGTTGDADGAGAGGGPAVAAARLTGRVLDRRRGRPIAGAQVAVLRAGAGEVVVPTGADGRFVVDGLAPGAARVRITAPDYQDLEQDETLIAGEELDATYRLSEDVDVDSFRAVARIEPPPREVTRRTITSEELTRVPGTRGDALRAIELLPGVGRPPGLAGLVLIRGSAPNDSQVFLEGQPVPLLYHFGGLTSFYNSRMIDRIDFYPGNFSVRYGRKVGGVIDVGVRDPRGDGIHGVADVNLIDASLLLEAPIGDRASFALAARRSYIDFFFTNVLPEGTFDVVAAPVYYDYQGILTWRPSSRDRVRLQVYGSSDRFEVVLPAPADGDPAVRGNIDLSTQFHRFQAGWRRQLTRDVDQNLEFAVGSTNLFIGVGNAFGLDLDTIPINGRAEWIARVSDRVRLIAGMDIQSGPATINFVGPPLGQQEGDPGGPPISAQPQIRTSAEAMVYRPGAYLESSLRPWDPLTIIAGLRLDWYRDIKWWSVDPRLAARLRLDDRWSLKAGLGLFSQPPEFQEAAPGVGNPNLLPIRAVHASAGFDHRFDEQWSLGIEGFYKTLDQRVVSTAPGADVPFDNAGIGRIYGLEVAGRANPRGRFFGFLSYTFSRSERRDRPGQDWRLFDFDQTHILTVSGVYRLGRGWEVGATFRLISGNPQTPIVGSVYDARSDLYIPINGAINSVRNPMFHRLDLRVEKQWRFANWKLALYLDIQNAYNRQNPEGTIYNFDFRQRQTLPGLPIIPSLGVRGEL